ncbi:MAG: hypothetical protein DIU66_002470 [Bacillota bacterium]|nr:MAG: hypothetical protein DIU66_01445 [Bacillota bacterium]
MEDRAVELAIARFIEIDDKAAEIKEAREKNLSELEAQYRREIHDMVENYNRKTEEKVKEIFSKALSEGESKVEELRKKSNELIEIMEAKYLKIKDDIINKFFNEIFYLKRF